MVIDFGGLVPKDVLVDLNLAVWYGIATPPVHVQNFLFGSLNANCQI